jgi:hypothetical protein
LLSELNAIRDMMSKTPDKLARLMNIQEQMEQELFQLQFIVRLLVFLLFLCTAVVVYLFSYRRDSVADWLRNFCRVAPPLANRRRGARNGSRSDPGPRRETASDRQRSDGAHVHTTAPTEVTSNRFEFSEMEA